MFETSPTTEKIDAALAKAQGGFKTAGKNAENLFLSTKYADFADVMEACRESLATNGIAVTQFPFNLDDKRATVVTRVAHSGEWYKSTFSVPIMPSKASVKAGKPEIDPQCVAAALTYCRRISFCAALGIVSEDEGLASTNTEGVILASGEDLDALNEKFNLSGWDVPQMRKYLSAHYNVKNSQELPASAITNIMKALELPFTEAMVKPTAPPPLPVEKEKIKNHAPGAGVK